MLQYLTLWNTLLVYNIRTNPSDLVWLIYNLKQDMDALDSRNTFFLNQIELEKLTNTYVL